MDGTKHHHRLRSLLGSSFRSFVPKVGLRPCMPCAGCGRWVPNALPEDWIRVGPPERGGYFSDAGVQHYTLALDREGKKIAWTLHCPRFPLCGHKFLVQKLRQAEKALDLHQSGRCRETVTAEDLEHLVKKRDYWLQRITDLRTQVLAGKQDEYIVLVNPVSDTRQEWSTDPETIEWTRDKRAEAREAARAAAQAVACGWPTPSATTSSADWQHWPAWHFHAWHEPEERWPRHQNEWWRASGWR